MATYNKSLKSLVIKTIGGTTINVADTATDKSASNALSEFEMFQTMHIKTQNNVTEVPFHAVDNIVVTSTSTEVEKADPYGCEEESSGDGDEEGNKN